MKVNGIYLPTLNVFQTMMTVPDCIVTNTNKLGVGNGEAKFYIASKDVMHEFYGSPGFTAECFMLKKDLIAYMNAIKVEYMNPSQDYRAKDKLPNLWSDRMELVNAQEEVIYFRVHDQVQIDGTRGYVNSSDNGYKLLRKLALPLVSYVYVEKVGKELTPQFYWKLFVDFEAIWEKRTSPLVFTYGGRNQSLQEPVQEAEISPSNIADENTRERNIRQAREGQGRYREQLLEQCHYCPVTGISDERLLIASHIKPWAASNDLEKIDPYNGYMLSPLFDKLFDRGFITFTESKRMIISEFLSPYTWRLLNITNNTYIQGLPMDEKRKEYLRFHHASVFKGAFEEG